ncbi:MAG: hypothetical protein HYY55_01870 [Candidatus Niyogibacteria bacterium]|nr:MAG: hypothetical protein HYY55_01870 [Candidatus Niyogibacteria bacterium]
MENKPKTSPKDFFLHLLAIIALYITAGSFVTLIFQYINIIFPDILEKSSYYLRSVHSSIRWAISSLIVVFPVYILTSWFLEKNYKKDPAKRNLRIRRWLIYFTLFAAAVIIIGDLATLVYNFLGGDLTARFVWKALTIFFTAGVVFGYYFYDIYKHKT